MRINRAFRYELDPNLGQRTLLARHAGVARFAYNWGLARQREAIVATGRKLSDPELRRELNARKATEFPWMYEVSKCAPQEALRDLDRAFQNWFRGRKERQPVGFPTPKRKFQHDAFRLTGSIHVRGRHVQLPRLGRIRLKEPPEVQGRILSATVSREVDRWYVSLAVEMEIPDPAPVAGPVAGIDVGLVHFATLVAGEEVQKIAAPRPLERYLRTLRRRQRKQSRKRKGSKNRKKSAVRLARLHRRIKNIRQDFLHRLSTHLAKTKRVIVVEDLNVSGMLRNRRLARHITDSGWSAFRRMLEYKCVWYGSSLQVANRFYPSSKTCSACGHVLEKLSLHIREWACPGCGAHHDRDVNAARNLAALTACRSSTASSAGIYARGDGGSGPAPVPVDEAGTFPARSVRHLSMEGRTADELDTRHGSRCRDVWR